MLVSGKIQWHKTVDVVVVGLGAAGAVADITAYDDGADVIILEKQPAQNHISNSSMLCISNNKGNIVTVCAVSNGSNSNTLFKEHQPQR